MDFRGKSHIVRIFFVIFLAFGGLFATSNPADAEARRVTDQAPFNVEVLQPVNDNFGVWWWRLRVLGGTNFAGSWERNGESFQSLTELQNAIKIQGDCQSNVVKQYLAGFQTQQDLIASQKDSKNGSWTSKTLISKIANSCSFVGGWQAKLRGTFDANGNWVAEIPYSQIPAGRTKVFLTEVTYSGSRSLENCKRAWPDGSWSGFDCLPKIGTTYSFVINVPKHLNHPKSFNGPDVVPKSFFDQSTFSSLKPVDFKELSAIAGQTTGYAGVLTVLVSVPTILLSKAIEGIHQKFASKDRFRWFDFSLSNLWALGIFFVAAIIDGFSDPQFGFNFKAVRLLITGFLAFVLMDFGRNHISWQMTKSRTGQEYPLLTAKPFFLLVIAATVAFARFTNIDPAMIFGSVIGLELGSAVSRTTKGVVKLVTVIYTFLVGLLAWFGYSWLVSLSPENIALASHAASSSWVIWLQSCQVTVAEFLSMIAVSAFSTVPLTLIPFGSLGGKPLLEWSRLAWVITYFIGLFGFAFVVLPMPKSWSEPSEPLVVWTSLLIGYTTIALVAFLAVTRMNNRAKG